MLKQGDAEESGRAVPALHAARWRFGEFELIEGHRELRRLGELIPLEPKPMSLLMLLLRRPGELVTKNELIEELWFGTPVNDASLAGCVKKLREALGPETGAWVKTVFGFGYRFDVVAELIPDPTAPVAAPKLAQNAGDAIPQRPNWQLVRRLGRSGDTWLAEHVKTRARRVFKFTADARGLSALKREVTIFRLLNESLGQEKACYVKMLDWNFDEPTWFIESEHCPGGSLEEWFEARGGVTKVPLAIRLDLIAQIAEALAEIHIIGVLHKDLKPANIFIVPGEGEQPRIRLGDFGSSRLLDSAQLEALQITLRGFTQVIDEDKSNSGTLFYLPPEVLAGHPATVKADIYALGVMLYQCLVGKLSSSLPTGWEQNIEDEMLREDIASACNGNPERRLADAAELARNLRSLEARRAVRAEEREAIAKAERAARALERMQARRIGMRLAFAALAVGFVVSAYLYVDARKARTAAEAETRRAEKVAAFLGEDMFKSVNTDEHPVRDLTVKQLLDSATAEVEKRFKDEPGIAAKVYESLGRSYERLEYVDAAQQYIERALKIHERQDGLGADVTLSLATEIIGITYAVGQLPALIDHYDDISRAGEQRLGPDDVRVLRLKFELARGRVQLGEWVRGEAEEKNVAERLTHLAAGDLDLKLQIQIALGFVQMDLAKFGDAERNIRTALMASEKQRGESHIQVAQQHARLARVMYETGRYQEAESELAVAEEIAAKWAAKDGSIPLTISFYRAWLRLKQNRPLETIQIAQEITKALQSTDKGQFDQSYAEDRLIALSHEKLGALELARETMSRALAGSTRSNGREHPMTKIIQLDLSEILILQGRNAEARTLLTVPKIMTMDDLPPTHPIVFKWRQLKEKLGIS